ncbi:MAG: peptidoglycan-associated lipoprotein Pal [Rhodospirillales bacterium]|nr:peptidoglycan-associated lipoprotein Pal [Rhodospirillales bacterium]MCB9994969.1 peptidoglycan-associated lipoprotein Pal [Rhodospirillales bacterium]
MFFRTIMMMALLVTVTACSTTDSADVSDIRVEERQDIAGGPLDGTEVYDRSVLDGPAPGTQQDLVVNVGDRVFYGYDRYDLTPEAQRTLEMQAEWLKRYPSVNVTIEGHCDERGTREYNLALGERRANAVKSYLVALGVDPMRVNTISFGKERPAVLGANDAAWAQNRRGVTVVD